MATTHEIRSAYIQAHANDMFSMYFTGDLRPIIEDKMTPNDHIYSGRSTRLVGGSNAYWKQDDGYFFVCGDAHEMKHLYDTVVRGFDVIIIRINDTDVISMRQLPKARSTKRVGLADYECPTTLAGMLTVADRLLLENDLER